MIIRKLFKFENAHIVRHCTSKICRSSLHGHSYKAEILLESNFLDNGQMVYDFGLMKNGIKDIISSFDHSVSIWNRDDPAYILAMKEHSERWIILPVSPSAEQLSRVIFVLIDQYLRLCEMVNGEKDIKLHSVIIHETDTGYAQCFKNDAFNSNMGNIDIMDIVFSDEVQNSWQNKKFYYKLVNNLSFINPKTI